MSYKIPFPGTATLAELDTTITAYQLAKTANVIDIEGRQATFDDGTNMNVNVAEFEPVDHRPQIHKELVFVLVADVDFGAMAAAGMTQLGGAGKKFTIYVSNKPQSIFVFYRL